EAQRATAVDLGIPWIQVGTLSVPFGFLIDQLSVTMMLIVTGVGGLIHIYSIGYMHGDPRFQRFFVYMNLFIASMLVLVMADSFLLMFVGWELVGLCSYLLIGFWFSNVKNAEAGRKAFVVNRIGDVGFILGILLIFATFGTLTFTDVFGKVMAMSALNSPVIVAITLLLFVGAVGKSAQIPLFVWLPDAMAGPTPVSALIHAATMVTAGIYMMTRAHVLYTAAPATQDVVALIGGLTAFVAGSIALTQYDIKKVLAYSTVSQLGFMVAAAGLGAYAASIFHLATHAFFKALLFLAAGSVIHGMEHLSKSAGAADAHAVDAQDMRNMGGLRHKMPVTFIVYVIGGLALSGVPPFAGFFSKDEIVAAAMQHNPLVFGLLGIAAVFTAFYIGRQLVMVFFGQPRTGNAEHAAESAPLMTIPLIVLAVLAAIAGVLNLPGVGTLGVWLGPAIGGYEVEAFQIGVAGLFTLLSVAALLGAWYVYRSAFKKPSDVDPLAGMGPLYIFLKRAWLIDALYQAVIVKLFYAASSFLARVFDIGGIDGLVNGTAVLVRNTSGALRRIQNGLVRSYGMMMLLGVVVIVAYFLWSAAAH
ncbi:MAG: NADH-quinone oxidoreductase subunit L, partial [Chloroflexi bacterium]|nr:NADH-quinone oxidoreductase subunit L [Chloroflexota bacterium]